MTVDVPPSHQCTLPTCEREAVDPTTPGSVCKRHEAEISGENGCEDTDVEYEAPRVEADKPTSPISSWGDADFTTPESDVWPPAWNNREFWMARIGKRPYAPWGDVNHPDGEDGKDARFKWSITDNWADKATADKWVSRDPRVDGHVVLLEDEDEPYTDDPDPYAFVDGDDVRCPESGEVHPVFVELLEQLGLTYADISTSGSGVHALYHGKLPDGFKQAVFDIDDEPWGENDSAPAVEIYDGKHVCVVTGEHVPGTPMDINAWDHDALEALLDEYTDEADRHTTEGHDTDHERPELDDYEPTVTGTETTDEIGDVFYAIESLRPIDLPLRARKVGTDSTGWEKWDPSSYRMSSGGDSLHRPADETVFHDHKTGHSFRLLSLFAAEQGIIRKPWDRLQGEDFWEAVDAAREAGAAIPEYALQERETEQHAVLPTDDSIQHAASKWDWRHAGEVKDGLTIDDARERTQGAIADTYERSDCVLVEALPTMGKTTSAIKAAAETGEQVTYLCPRREVMDEVAEKARGHDLDVYKLPSMPRHCTTANGEHGQDWRERVMDWYERGASPKDIHANAEYELGRPLPCQEHKSQECPYTSMWRFDPDDYDVLIGHYVHGHKPTVTEGRTVVFDEFPAGSYETTLGYNLEASVSAFLSLNSELPFSDYTDLIENRSDPQKRAKALQWFEDNEPDNDETLVFDSDFAYAQTPHAVYTILASNADDLGNGWERASLPADDGIGLFDRERGVVHLMMPPSFTYTSAVVAMDGTPTKRMWELTLGTRLNHRQVLTDAEREEYISDVLNLRLVPTTEYMKPYSGNPDYVNVDKDRALLEGIRDHHGQKPVAITTKTAEGVYESEGVLDETRAHEHYGNLKSSNEFAKERLGAVIGSNHYGDDYIKRWGAYAGEVVERNDEKGVDLSYGAFGDRVYQNMTHYETLQAAMRFGRDGNGATVYVNTAALPEWVPVAGEGRVLTVWSDGMKEVLEAANKMDSWRTKDIVEHPAVEISERQVRDHLNTLAERGYLSRTVEGRGYIWKDDGLHRVNDSGDVEIDVVADDDVVAEVESKSTYTWDFRNTPASAGTSERETVLDGGDAAPDTAVEGVGDDPPPS